MTESPYVKVGYDMYVKADVWAVFIKLWKHYSVSSVLPSSFMWLQLGCKFVVYWIKICTQSLSVHANQLECSFIILILLQGLKTGMYYLRTRPAANAIQFTVDKSRLQQKNTNTPSIESVSFGKERPDAAAVLMCSLQNKENCLMCSSWFCFYVPSWSNRSSQSFNILFIAVILVILS